MSRDLSSLSRWRPKRLEDPTSFARYLQVISAVRSDEMSAPFQEHIIKDMIAAIANTKLKETEQIYVCKIVSYDKQPPLPLT